jgi:hypothetical protein
MNQNKPLNLEGTFSLPLSLYGNLNSNSSSSRGARVCASVAVCHQGLSSQVVTRSNIKIAGGAPAKPFLLRLFDRNQNRIQSIVDVPAAF